MPRLFTFLRPVFLLGGGLLLLGGMWGGMLNAITILLFVALMLQSVRTARRLRRPIPA